MFSRGKDINRLLRDWSFDSSKVNVRRIIGDDGKEKIQLRLDLGILQMEIDGRPDGKRPFGNESLLEYHLGLLKNFKKKITPDAEFRLTRDECAALQQEAIQYYHRYLSLFHLGEYDGVVRDTTRNLKVFDLIRKYAEDPKDRQAFDQFRPYVIMMNIRASASLLLKTKNFKKAIAVIHKGIDKLEEFYLENEFEAQLNSSPELGFLRRWLDEIGDIKPTDPIKKLKHELDEAVKKENYELAAKIRDQLKEIDKPFSINDII